MRLSGWIVSLVLILVTGCSSTDDFRAGGDVIFLVPGVGGGGPGYGALTSGLREGGIARRVVTVEWGAPMPLFMMNFSDPSVHEEAEAKLAHEITHARRMSATARIDLIGHSAGAGVVAGALARLPADVHVHTVLLLSPSFSPQYPIQRDFTHVDGAIHLFYSDRDSVFLDWRASTFGTYDGMKTKAAGNTGMSGLNSPKFIQHPYNPSWDVLGNDGGHYGTIAEEFSRQVLAPLLKPVPSTLPATRNDSR